jgi:hypothetical protein
MLLLPYHAKQPYRYRDRNVGQWAQTYAANTFTSLERETASRRPWDTWADKICLNIMQDSQSQWPRGRGFESHRGHGRLSVVCVVCCQEEVSATSRSLFQRSTTDCGASLCVIKKPRERGGHSPGWAAEPEKINKYITMQDIRCSRCKHYDCGISECDAVEFNER